MCAACACPTSYSEFRRQPQEEEAEEGQGEVEGGPGGPLGEEAEEEEAAAGPSFCLLCRLRTCLGFI